MINWGLYFAGNQPTLEFLDELIIPFHVGRPTRSCTVQFPTIFRSNDTRSVAIEKNAPLWFAKNIPSTTDNNHHESTEEGYEGQQIG